MPWMPAYIAVPNLVSTVLCMIAVPYLPLISKDDLNKISIIVFFQFIKIKGNKYCNVAFIIQYSILYSKMV
jgi:hypothetical protein